MFLTFLLAPCKEFLSHYSGEKWVYMNHNQLAACPVITTKLLPLYLKREAKPLFPGIPDTCPIGDHLIYDGKFYIALSVCHQVLGTSLMALSRSSDLGPLPETPCNTNLWA